MDINTADVSIYQLVLMKHAIGFDHKKVKRGKYIAWRNYFCSGNESKDWERLVSKGLATKDVRENANYYFVTDKGMEFVGNVLGLKIVEDKD